MLLCNPLIDTPDTVIRTHEMVETPYVKSNGIQFTRGSITEYRLSSQRLLSIIENHIRRVTSRWRVKGPEVASTLIAALQDFGDDAAFITEVQRENDGMEQKAMREIISPYVSIEEQLQATASQAIEGQPASRKLWNNIEAQELEVEHRVSRLSFNGCSHETNSYGSAEVVPCAYSVAMMALSIHLDRIGKKNVLHFTHIILGVIWSFSYIPALLTHVENYPWRQIAAFLNTVDIFGVFDIRIERDESPRSLSGTCRQLPGDFVIRGLLWSRRNLLMRSWISKAFCMNDNFCGRVSKYKGCIMSKIPPPSVWNIIGGKVSKPQGIGLVPRLTIL